MQHPLPPSALQFGSQARACDGACWPFYWNPSLGEILASPEEGGEGKWIFDADGHAVANPVVDEQARLAIAISRRKRRWDEHWAELQAAVQADLRRDAEAATAAASSDDDEDAGRASAAPTPSARARPQVQRDIDERLRRARFEVTFRVRESTGRKDLSIRTPDGTTFRSKAEALRYLDRSAGV